MENRYARSLGALSEAEISALHAAKVAVIGCGGLGGFAIEELTRLGVGTLVLADPDCFEESNLNRQFHALEDNLGKSKAMEAARRVGFVNSRVKCIPFFEALSKKNAAKLISGCDVVIDALDSGKARHLLAEACTRLEIPLVHGAIDGWRAQVSVLMPGSTAFDYMYPEGCESGKQSVSLSFTPAVAASIEVCEAVKLIIKRGVSLSGRLLMIDLLNEEYNIIEL